jgi:hypothetical protein
VSWAHRSPELQSSSELPQSSDTASTAGRAEARTDEIAVDQTPERAEPLVLHSLPTNLTQIG